jgi:hypothetical protein
MVGEYISYYINGNILISVIINNNNSLKYNILDIMKVVMSNKYIVIKMTKYNESIVRYYQNQ